MNIDDGDTGSSVAVYWDFENLHAGVLEAKYGEGAYAKQDARFKPQEPIVDVQALVELAASFGPVAINRAYGNWQFFGRYRDALLQTAVELIQLFPPGASAKNGADIKLCLDATEDLSRFDHIGTVIIVGGDSDFMPVAQKIKAAGRKLIGIGTRRNTNKHWAKSCHEFRYYDSLVEAEPTEQSATPEAKAASAPPVVDPATELLRRAALRGIGLGSLLVRPLIAWMKARTLVSVQPINLSGDDARTEEARDRRNRFYEKLGFVFDYQDERVWGESRAMMNSALVLPPMQLSRGWKVESLKGKGQVF